MMEERKVAVVGAGQVGSTFAYALANEGVADDIAIIDVNEQLARGQVLDLAHGQPFMPPVNIHQGSPEDYTDSHIIVITAGAKQKSGESRLDLLRRNAEIVGDITKDIRSRKSEAVIVVVTNPVDVLTRVVLEQSGWERHRVMGSGTVLDTARFRYLLSRHCGVDARNVHAYILGEHGDSEIAPWSLTHIAGMPMDDYCVLCGKHADWRSAREQVVEQVRNSAYHIIDYKGATSFAVGLALVRICGAILRNEHSVLTFSTMLDGEYGLEDVCLSVPCLVSRRGIERIISGPLTEAEREGLAASARVLKEAWSALRSES